MRKSSFQVLLCDISTFCDELYRLQLFYCLTMRPLAREALADRTRQIDFLIENRLRKVEIGGHTCVPQLRTVMCAIAVH